jgi:hypothetical protein
VARVELHSCDKLRGPQRYSDNFRNVLRKIQECVVQKTHVPTSKKGAASQRPQIGGKMKCAPPGSDGAVTAKQVNRLIDDETGVEFTITHTFVDPPKRDETVDIH